MSNAVYAWGQCDSGQLGLCEDMGAEAHQSEPKEIGDLLNNKIIAIDANADQSFAVTNEGLVYSWGDGAKGQLGQGNRLPSFKPKLVEALVTKRIIAIATGFDHTLALSEDGDVYSWGSNSYGQLGLGHEKSTSSPKFISAFKEKQVIRISAGGSFSAALTKEGYVYTWGWGFDGRLGHLDNKDLSLPKKVAGIDQVVDIAAGFGHMLAVTETGELYSWGNNTKGQLGHGDKKDRNRPKLVVTKIKFYRVHAGFGHSLALSDKNTVYSWGSGSAELLRSRPDLTILLLYQRMAMFIHGDRIAMVNWDSDTRKVPLVRNLFQHSKRNKLFELALADLFQLH
eukprot:TRINITY_DN8072_c0_g1_i1.p1 TRINITY_DN8072_c0_g1~~TRINITY_DN8072_c0_g1_i1.p1  ORF type:complete len:340 (+),score=28.89 TRINITY_DN8072_c0_g1_i1:48-1067(+)